MRCIVYSRPDRGVSVCHPSNEIMAALRDGGYIRCEYLGREGLHLFVHSVFAFKLCELWPFLTRGVVPIDVARAWEIHKIVNNPAWRRGCPQREVMATRWIDALINGGCDEVRALELVAERSVPMDASAIEVWDVSELPTDRWFRDAWIRSDNGGPIVIDLKRARQIQFERARAAAVEAAKKRAKNMALFDAPEPAIDWRSFANRIRAAMTDGDLRMLWPSELA